MTGSRGLLCTFHSEPPERRAATDESGKEFVDIVYEKAVGEGIAKITINRPNRRNDARDDSSIGVIILTGREGTTTTNARDDSSKKTKAFPRPWRIMELGLLTVGVGDELIFDVLADQGTEAFCSGGDQALRDSDGYVDFDSFGRLNVLDLQVQIRRLPKPVIAMVAGYAVGGGHVLHMAGYGSSIMSRLVGPKRAREMWFLSRFYTADEADKMGLVNIVVPADLKEQPHGHRVLKSALKAADDGHAGLQELGENATLIFYGTEKAKEGKNAYMERRRSDFSKFPQKP
ncbi:unnamed protein product [Miscanthus lutarioriparius]|uniref:Uncharacterized protein n=1 Tax=Miscanthus lutarioriparius TaxID=422564 RepID=A0A811Q115_9POAL|nr:unnamed protein product [Miscanthus lutarioriparius]